MKNSSTFNQKIEALHQEFGESISEETIGDDNTEWNLLCFISENLGAYGSAEIEDWWDSYSLHVNYSADDHTSFIPTKLTDFLIEFLSLRSAKEILVPIPDDLALLPSRIDDEIICDWGGARPENRPNLTVLLSKGALQEPLCGANVIIEPDDFLSDNSKLYDAIITCIRDRDWREWSQQDHLITSLLPYLTDDGSATFFLPPSFFDEERPGRVQFFSNLHKSGFSLESIIGLPDCYTSKWSRRCIATFKRSTQSKVFLAMFSEEQERPETTLQVFREGKGGRGVREGIRMSFDQLLTPHRLESIEKSKTLLPDFDGKDIRLGDLLKKKIDSTVVEQKDAARASKEEEDPSGDNPSEFAIAETMIQFSTWEDVPTDILIKGGKQFTYGMFKIEVDANLVNRIFLMYFLNETDLGYEVRNLLRDDDYPLLHLNQRWEDESIYLPSLEIQNEIVESISLIDKLKNDLSGYKSDLLTCPRNFAEIKSRIADNSPDDSRWLEHLPFPLASILWEHQSTRDSPEIDATRRQKDTLFHFFEALAQFTAVLSLSAWKKDKELWPEAESKVKDALKKNNKTLKQADFGTWKVICESLFKQARELKEKKKERVMKLYHCNTAEHLDLLTSKKLLKIFQTAIALRNDTKGHGGIEGPEVVKILHQQLYALLQKTRPLIEPIWRSFQLVEPLHSRYDHPFNVYTVRRLAGTRTPFFEDVIEMRQPLQDGQMHVVNPVTATGFPLIPLIQLLKAKKTKVEACYYYNKLERDDSARFVSYHFKSENTQSLEFSQLSLGLEGLLEV